MVDPALSAASFGARATAILLLALWLVLPSAPRAAAPAPPPETASAQSVPAPVSAAELQRLVDTLQDDAERARLVEELRALIAAQRGIEASQPEATPPTVLTLISQRTETISEEVLSAAAVVVDLPRLASWLREQATDPVFLAFLL